MDFNCIFRIHCLNSDKTVIFEKSCCAADLFAHEKFKELSNKTKRDLTTTHLKRRKSIKRFKQESQILIFLQILTRWFGPIDSYVWHDTREINFAPYVIIE